MTKILRKTVLDGYFGHVPDFCSNPKKKGGMFGQGDNGWASANEPRE
jgi:hypothetical protein